MKLAAVDIGSNAIRFQITNVLVYNGKTSFKKVEYVRFPLRLGQDVFTLKHISPEKEAKFIKLMHTFKMLFELYEVEDYIICATSAMRESANGQEIADKVKSLLGLEINIINGDKEAEIINKIIYNELADGNFIHIDVGGGSTELNIFKDKVKVAAHSFRIGHVRKLGGEDSPEEWNNMRTWLSKHVTPDIGIMKAIGTGGNITKIYELANLPRTKGESPSLNISHIETVQNKLSGYTLEEKINILMLNPDRADVILPALEIYATVMKLINATDIAVPDVGLKDGLLMLLYEKNLKSLDSQI